MEPSKTMTTEDAQKALDDFWEDVNKKHGPNLDGLDYEDRQKLLELEKQYSAATKSDAAKN